MSKNTHIAQLAMVNAMHQSMIGIVLIAGFPLMAILYMAALFWMQPDEIPLYIPVVLFSSTIILAVAGFVILLKFPKNIMRLRRHIEGLAPTGRPARIHLVNTSGSDDLHHIETDLNVVLQKMRRQVEKAEESQLKEHQLREQVESQQRTLVQAERHRAMIQSLGAACHHLGQPVTSLRMRLYLMKQHDDLTAEERRSFAECEQDLDNIERILERLRTVSQFRTEPYTGTDAQGGTEILSI